MSTPKTPNYWPQACKELSAADPVMKKLIRSYKGEMLKARGDAFYTLARSIIGQQISVKAADTVWGRLSCHPALVAGSGQKSPDAAIQRHDITRLTDEQLRSCGLSGQKVKYLREIVKFFESHQYTPNWEESDEMLIKQLTSIKGVGRWTAEMFMIFHLLRPNVLPIADLGLLKSIHLHYNQGETLPKDEIFKLAEKWQPWQTVATWYLWRALDPMPVEY